MRYSHSIQLVSITGLTLSMLTALPSCVPARSGGSPTVRGVAQATTSNLGGAVSAPRQNMAENETAVYVWNTYHYLSVSNATGVDLYDFLAGPTSKDIAPPGQPDVEVELSRPASTPPGGPSAIASRVAHGGGYIRGTWPVPATKRVRGTTATFTLGQVTSFVANTHQGGLVVYTDATRDIIFVEPAQAGQPADPQVPIQVLSPAGVEQTQLMVEAGFYYILTSNSANTLTLISEPFPWDSTGHEMPHNAIARAAFNSIRNAAISSGVSSLKGLPPLTGP